MMPGCGPHVYGSDICSNVPTSMASSGRDRPSTPVQSIKPGKSVRLTPWSRSWDPPAPRHRRPGILAANSWRGYPGLEKPMPKAIEVQAALAMVKQRIELHAALLTRARKNSR